MQTCKERLRRVRFCATNRGASSTMALPAPSILELRGVLLPTPAECSAPAPFDLVVRAGDFLWLTGPAAGAREAAFRLLQLAEVPVAGEILLEGQKQAALTLEARSQARAQRFGILSAHPFLIPSFSAIENIAVPLLKASRVSLEAAQEQIAGLLHFVGLRGQEDQPASRLSPSGQRRLALARALANAPLALFVEDWEQALQAAETEELIELLHRAGERFSVAVLVSAEAPLFARPADRVLHFAGGTMRSERTTAPALSHP